MNAALLHKIEHNQPLNKTELCHATGISAYTMWNKIKPPLVNGRFSRLTDFYDFYKTLEARAA